MRTSVSAGRTRLRSVLALCGLIATMAIAVAPASAAGGATLRIDAPASAEVGRPIVLTFRVEDSTDLAGYEAQLLFDRDAAHLNTAAQRSNDLRRLGRGVVPLGPEEVNGGVAFGVYSCPVMSCVARRDRVGGVGRRSSLTLGRIAITPDRPGLLELRLGATRFVDSAGRTLAVAAPQRSIWVHVAGKGTTHRYAAPALGWQLQAHPERDFGRVDLSGDGIVSHADVMAVRYAWTVSRVANGDPCHASLAAASDVNGDGCVDVADLQGIAGRYSPASLRPTSAGGSSGPGMNGAQGPDGTSGTAASVTYTVDSTGDQADADKTDGICATSSGTCTLRAAIDTANRHVGNDRVEFAIAGGGTKTITLGSRLPIINEQNGSLTIDGYTQPGAAVNTSALASDAVIRIQITGPGESTKFTALYITSANNTIRGLAFYGLWRDLWLDGPGAHHNAIVGNFIGTNAAGTYSTPSWVSSANGALVLDNGAHDNLIGRPVLADRNVVSGGPASGVYHTKEGTRDNVTQNNIIGLNPAGTARVPNKLEGVDFNFGASDNLVGGTGPLERNVSSGNNRTGFEASHGTNTVGNRLVGNFVGTNLAGTLVSSYSGNRHFGIHVEDGVGDTEVTDNIVAGNTDSGVRIDGIDTRNTLVARNRIGLTIDGTPGANATSGIRIVYRTTGGLITENEIAYNPRGIEVRDPDNDFFTFSRNSIHDNTGLGIDLQPVPGVNANDAGDGDGGGNQQLNYPVIGTATPTLVSGTACAACTVEIFLADSAAGQHGEGETFVGSATAGAGGSFSATVAGVSQGDVVTATATDANGNTSEFSMNIAVGPANVFASDSFSRTVADRWGTADNGGTYSHNGTLADFDINGSAATLVLPAAGANRAGHLLGVSGQDVDVRYRFRVDEVPVGGSLFLYQVVRQQSAGNEYRIKLRIANSGQVYAHADRLVGGATTALGSEVPVAGLVLAPDTWINLRSQVTGTSPTTLRVKAWVDGTAEPASWTYTSTDATAQLQAAGAVGIRAYLGTAATNSPLSVSFDDYTVSAP